MKPQPAPAIAARDASEAVPGTGHPVAILMSVDARGMALGILATVAVVFALDWGQKLLVPLLLGVILAYTLNPLVNALERLRFPRVLGTALVIAAVVCALVLGTYSLRGQMQTLVAQLPVAASKLSATLTNIRDKPGGNMQKMQSAVGEMEKATTQTASVPTDPRRPPAHVVVDAPGFRLGDFMWANSMGAVGLFGQAAMVIFLVFFLLVGGDTFKRKLVRLTGPTLSKRKITITMLDEINESIQKYMFMLLATNLLLGLVIWVAFRWIGLENAGAWAVTAGLLHIIPYLGPALVTAGVGMAAFMQFDSLSMVLVVAGASLAISTLVGTFVTTWMTGKILRMNAAAVFISLLFWGWLWGVWGMLLGIPIIVILMVVSQHLEQLQPMAELLGE